MQRTALVVALILCFMIGVFRIGSAQQPGPLTIRSVTMDVSGSILIITGTGFGPNPQVTIDGDPVAPLGGGSDAQVSVLAPATLLTTPGTYRLTVADPQHQVRDVFVVAAGTGMVSSFSSAATGAATGASGASSISQPTARGTVDSTSGGGVQIQAGGGAGLGLVEDTSNPYRTAIGYQALFSNTTGSYNTAAGYNASRSNTTGTANLAAGAFTMYYNTTGSFNIGLGYEALTFNTTGSYNTATGTYAALSNTTGTDNTASGYGALYANTAGSFNTATGYRSLYNNISGHTNSAHGLHALFSNTTGATNTASGAQALYLNTTGSSNTAVGLDALYSNTTGVSNTALGEEAGFYPTTGNYNLFLGAEVFGSAADTNTTRIGNPYDGTTTPPSGQNRTFISGIRGTAVSGALPVVIDASGQLGTSGGVPLNLHDATNTLPYQLRLGYINGLYDYGIGRNPGDGVLDFAATQSIYSGYRFSTPTTGPILTLTGTGKVGVGITAPTQPLQMASGAYVSVGGVWTNASSRTLKDRITPVSSSTAAETLAQLTPVTFVYKASPSETHVGFIAEDVPDLVASQDRRGLAAMDLVAVVTKVVQTQQQQLEDQQATIDDLRARLARLESLLTAKSDPAEVPR